MNILKKTLFVVTIVTVLLLALPQQALAASPGKVVLGDTFTLESGEVLNEDLLILGGTVRLEEGSTVNGNVMVMGGNLFASGFIRGDVTVVGGNVSFQNSATVTGNLSSLGGQVQRDQDVQIQGDTFNNQNIPFGIMPGNWRNDFVFPAAAASYPVLDLGWFLLRVVLWGLVSMLIVMFLPSQTERVARAVTSQPLVAGGLGIATGLILPIVLVVLAITICLLPISLIGFLALFLAWAYGLIAMGFELGKRFGRVFKQEWHPALAAGVGTFLLTLMLNGVSAVLPCLGWVPQVLVGALGLGAVLLTRAGTKDYPYETAAIEPVEVPPAS
jgi:hypothetical protein